MTHFFMNAVAAGLFDRGIATLRYQFPYMQKGAKRPDPPATAHATVRAAVAEAARRCPELPIIAGCEKEKKVALATWADHLLAAVEGRADKIVPLRA
jgi:predicted alpha/beta-hydrolase family hydrolase